MTFTGLEYTVSQPGLNPAGVPDHSSILWKLRSRGELRQPFSFYWDCGDRQCPNCTVRTMGALGVRARERGGVAGDGGAAGLPLSRLALMQLLLPPWRRMLIGGIALEVLLMSLLAPAFLSVRWTVYATAASVPPLAPSSGEATQRQLIPEAARPRLSPMQIVR